MKTDLTIRSNERRYRHSATRTQQPDELLGRLEFEQALLQVGGIDPNSLRVNTFGVYCDVYDTELTVAPVESTIIEEKPSGFVVPGTSIETEANATILVKKIYNRMMVDNRFEVRDAFDIAEAKQRDPQSLVEIFARISRNDVDDLIQSLKGLPTTWLLDADKPLIGVKSSLRQDDLISSVCECLRESVASLRG